MTNQDICLRLNKIEIEKGVRILFAVESGSRAWGFESPDSDWDVRFIYVKPIEWYMRVWPSKRDVIEVSDMTFDACGLDLKKALGLYVKTNPSMLEWLYSPIVYMDDGVLSATLKDLLPNYFNPYNAVFHYYSMAKKHDERYLRNHGATMKRFLYYLRGLLACRWIIEPGTAPAVLFTELVKGTVNDSLILTGIDSLLEHKRKSKKHDQDVVEPLLVDYCKALATDVKSFLEDKSYSEPPCDRNSELDQLLYQMALVTK